LQPVARCSDHPVAISSVWPIVAGLAMNDTGVPFGIVPCAKGGTSISQWQPGLNHFNRTTLYGSMAYRARQVSGVKAVLWWQGTTDAIAGTTQAAYHDYLARLAAAVQADLGVPLMVAKNERWANVALAKETPINAAVVQAWTDVPNIVPGPDLSDIVTDSGGPHLLTDAHLALAGQRWWAAIQAVASATFITSNQPGAVRNDSCGLFGMDITIGPNPITVNSLGRLVAPGNSHVHSLQIVDPVSGTTIASTTVNTQGAGAGHLFMATWLRQ